MKLYHFTSASLAKAVLSDNLSHGHLDLHTGHILQGVVWFTSLPSPEGTGVPMEARKMSEREVEKATRVQGELRNEMTGDKSKIRLSVDTSSLSPFGIVDGNPNGLISFVEWCGLIRAPKQWVKCMGLSALYDLDALSDEELSGLLGDKDSSKEHSWFIHFGPIESDLISAVDFKTDNGYVPYDFETHGREAMSDLGIECIKNEAHQRLLEIVKPAHPHEIVHAAVVCREPSDIKMVFVRGLGNTCFFNIETRKAVALMKDDPNYPLRDVASWVEEHNQEIMSCWNSAVEGYYRFYPDKKVGMH